MLLDVLVEKDFPINNLVLCASEKSLGKEIKVKDKFYSINLICNEIFKDINFAFFCAGSSVSKYWVKIALDSGCIVIDNSSYFRMKEDCSLIIPEVNFNDLNTSGIIANPNCSTIQSVICLNALKKFKFKRIIYTTYQSISGSGNNALINRESFYPYDINKTCIPKIDEYLENGYTLEEMKMINETKKILNLPNLCVTSTCVRVPVDYSHGVNVLVEFENEFSTEEVLEELKKQEGIVIVETPTSIHSNGNDMVYIGRIKKDISNPKTLMFYCVADNIRRGAASNAVLIALKIIKNGIAYKI